MFATILSIVAGIVTILVWFLNPKAVKARKLKGLHAKRNDIEKKMDLARLEGRETDYVLLKLERDEVNKEISIIA